MHTISSLGFSYNKLNKISSSKISWSFFIFILDVSSTLFATSVPSVSNPTPRRLTPDEKPRIKSKLPLSSSILTSSFGYSILFLI